MSAKTWLKFIGLGLIWGSSFFWIKIGLQDAGHFTLVFFRVFFATVGLGLFFLLTRKRLPLKYWWIFLFLGFFNVAFPFVLVTWSEHSISSGLAAILNSTQPLATMVIAAIFIKEERLSTQRILALILGITGVLILMSNRISGNEGNQVFGILAMIIAVLCYGSCAVFARINNQGLRPEDQSLGQMAFALIFIIPALFTFESPVRLPTHPISYFAFAWLGLLGSFVAGIIWYALLNEIGPSRASTIMYMFPLVGVALGVVILGEKVDWRLIVGGILILAAIVIVNTRKKENVNFVTIENEQYEG